MNKLSKILFLLLSDMKTLIFSSRFVRIHNHSCLNTLPKSTKTHRREGSHSRRESECVCVSEGVWESKGASQIEGEREGKREGSKSGPGDRVLTNLQGADGLCERDQRPWCPRAARDSVPCWLWHSSWDAAWLSASARTTRSPSCSKGSVLWCATRTLPRTEGSPPHLAYQSAPLGQKWLFPPCVEPTMSRQRWATRLWPSILTRSGVY